jgi:hypothetical protein
VTNPYTTLTDALREDSSQSTGQKGSDVSELDAIEFVVNGWPPNKNEAKSLFAVGHPKANRVRALLAAARDATLRDGWSLAIGLVALELTIYCPVRPAGDATNFLGGVADVLQGTTP